MRGVSVFLPKVACLQSGFFEWGDCCVSTEQALHERIFFLFWHFRWCDVKVPESQELKVNKAAASCKIFVTNITEAISMDDLKEHFETFGTVTDVYVPKPHRY